MVANKPRQNRRCIEHAFVLCRKLACRNHRKLFEITVGIDEHGTWLGIQKDDVFWLHIACLGLFQSFAVNYPEVGVFNVFTYIEFVLTVERATFVILALTMIYFTQI